MKRKITISLFLFGVITLTLFILPHLKQNHLTRQAYKGVETIAIALDPSEKGCTFTTLIFGASEKNCNIHEDYDFKIITHPVDIDVKDSEDRHFLLITRMTLRGWENGDIGYIIAKETTAGLKIVEYNLSAGTAYRQLPQNIEYIYPSQFLSNNEDVQLFVLPVKNELTYQGTKLYETRLSLNSGFYQYFSKDYN